MPDSFTRQSLIDHLLVAAGAEWRRVGDVRIATRFPTAPSESESLLAVGLCDLSVLAKLGIKGRDSEAWLRDQNVDTPVTVYESRRLADDGFIVRLAADEFFLESGIKNETVLALSALLDSHSGHLFRVERQEATFLLVGRRALEVLAQTCGIDFRQVEPHRLIYTRVAGVSCAVLPESRDTPAFRLWVDCSYAVYLWETLIEISESLGGGVIGTAEIFGDLTP